MVMKTHSRKATIVLTLRGLLPHKVRKYIKVTNFQVGYDTTSHIKVSL